MAEIERKVADHYTSGGLTARIKEALTALGVDPAKARPDDLKPVDEFHTAGVQATDDLLDQLEITGRTRILDIGCGLGGTPRHIAHRFGTHVTGIDLTPEFIETAKDLSALVGLADLADFHIGSALALPCADAAFDLALMLHVGMNIEDKTAMMAEVRRVLAPGGTFALFDVMRREDETTPIDVPVPWSEVAETSFVAPLKTYTEAAEAAGFEIIASRVRTQFALDFFAAVFAKAEAEGPSPLGIHLMMKDTAGEKIQNYLTNVKTGRISPTELILRAP
ncbi:MAG: methyltransferase domain-containing protein [Pseudomonadota bacterium]